MREGDAGAREREEVGAAAPADARTAPASPDAAERSDPGIGEAAAARLAVRVPVVYAAAASAWILASDALLAAISPSVDVHAAWSVAKGFAFVAVTTLALHAGLRWALGRERRAREALRRYQLLAGHGHEVILFVRPSDGRVLDANAAASAAYGYTRDELRALTVHALRAPGAEALTAEADARGIRFETVHRRRDGTAFPVEVSSQGADLDGARVLVSVVRDITQRKVAQDALRESEERLALALEAAGLGTFHAVPWGPLALSPRCREIFGVGAGETVPDFEAFLRRIHPDDRERVRADADRWLDERGHGRYHGEYRCVRPDGGVRWISAHGIARFADVDGARTPVRLVGTVLDVTERKRAEEKLAASGRELLALVEKLPVGVFVSRAGRIAYANPTLAAYLGAERPADLVGRAPEEVLGEPEPPAAGAGAWSDDEPHVPLPGREWRVQRRDGGVATLESSATREIEFDGERAVLCVLRDLTELKAVQAQLMQADRLASIGILAAGVAHEINNPLAYLTSALEFLAERLPALPGGPGAERDEALRALEEARDGAARVRHVARDLGTFSAMREERRVPLDVRAVVESAVNLAAGEIRPRARLVRTYRSAPPVLANEARLGQIVLNLLVNAAQAIPEGHAEENEIGVSTGADGQGRAVIEVSDTGCGIPAELADRIFDPFFTTKPKGVGTGLGLSICRSIAVALGGDVAFERRAGPGTVFRVTLPAAPAAATAAAPARAPPPAAEARGRRGRVLVVDDEPVVASAIRRLLAAEHDVVVTTRAEDARDAIARGERFDAILCDLMMPHMTGMDLHAALLRLAPDQAARMVVLTGGAFTERGRDFLGRVALPRVDKPFDATSLKALVRTLVP